MKNHSKLLNRMRRERKGPVHPVWEYLDGVDPEFLAAYNDVAVLNFNYGRAPQGRALNAKVKELIAVALLAAVRGDTTRQHIEKAMAHGASRREVVEALEMAMHITGAPSLEFGLVQLMEVERKK
jgi:alkylhydroperoxidase/carboxymuconolactone decarboxylase family protein YurZ